MAKPTSLTQKQNLKGLKSNLIERAAAISEVKLDDLSCEAGRLPPDLRADIKAVVTLYWRSRNAANASNKA